MKYGLRLLLYITNRSKDVIFQNRALRRYSAKILLVYREMLCSFNGNLLDAVFALLRNKNFQPVSITACRGSALNIQNAFKLNINPMTTVIKYQEVLSDIVQHAQFVSFKNALARSFGNRTAKKIHLQRMD